MDICQYVIFKCQDQFRITFKVTDVFLCPIRKMRSILRAQKNVLEQNIAEGVARTMFCGSRAAEQAAKLLPCVMCRFAVFYNKTSFIPFSLLILLQNLLYHLYKEYILYLVQFHIPFPIYRLILTWQKLQTVFYNYLE